MRAFLRNGVAGLVLWALAGMVRAEDKPAEKKEPKEEASVTSHTNRMGGEEIIYQATAGTLLLKDEEGKAKASFFYTSYARTNLTNLAARPITFSFNGGPGSSSVWLHLGVLGPRRVVLNEDGSLPAPPFRLEPNEYSILDQTDLVFIDPISTGYSRPAPGEDAKKYHGVDEDVQSVGEFIRLYVTKNKRWSSPKYLIGESYGTTRAAGLSGFLQDRHGMYLNGIMLISAVLDFQTISFTAGNDLPFALFLPGYTATAWYHKKLDPALQQSLAGAVAEARQFASGEYATALLQGDPMPPATRDAILPKLARLTGLSTNYLLRANLRPSASQFFKELLRDERRSVGRFDSRLTGIDRDGVGDTPDFDPSYVAVQGPFTATLNDYLRSDLKFESDLPYEILTGNVQPWNFGEYKNRFLNVAETLRSVMTKNTSLRVFIANGYYDLATPFAATEHTVRHLGLDPSLSDHVKLAYYEAGHMMYTHKPSLEKLHQDLAEFLGGH